MNTLTINQKHEALTTAINTIIDLHHNVKTKEEGRDFEDGIELDLLGNAHRVLDELSNLYTDQELGIPVCSDNFKETTTARNSKVVALRRKIDDRINHLEKDKKQWREARATLKKEQNLHAHHTIRIRTRMMQVEELTNAMRWTEDMFV